MFYVKVAMFALILFISRIIDICTRIGNSVFIVCIIVEDVVSNLPTLTTSTMNGKLDQSVQQARPLTDVLESHQYIMDREAPLMSE